MTQSLCRLDDFKDNCGFGLIAHTKGKANHQLLQNAITALTCMTHRGGVAADGKTGDGCGLLLQKPDGFLRAKVKEDSGKDLPGDWFLLMIAVWVRLRSNLFRLLSRFLLPQVRLLTKKYLPQDFIWLVVKLK
jgi:hypothetical protein